MANIAIEKMAVANAGLHVEQGCNLLRFMQRL